MVNNVGFLISKYLVKLWFFQRSSMDVIVRQKRKLSAEELMLLNWPIGENS